jgi:DNA-3-methyladenine glycosylase
MLKNSFFARDAITVAKELLGKVMRVKYQNIWLKSIIIETESYFLNDKASHSSKGYTEKRKALFMSPGTIYMYYSRAGASMNISCGGAGDAVLIKSGYPYMKGRSAKRMIATMQQLNPCGGLNSSISVLESLRPITKLCSGQALLCRSLGLTVADWDQQQFDLHRFYIEDVGYRPKKIIEAKRLGIPEGYDDHLLYRFIDFDKAIFCTKNPLKKSTSHYNCDYKVVSKQ